MFISQLISPIFVLRWVDQPLLVDVDLLAERVQSSFEKIGSDRLIYVAIIPDGIATPTADVRDALQEKMKEARKLCLSIHLVVEGGGLRNSIIRAVLAGILYETSSTRRSSSLSPVSVHASFQEALRVAHQKVFFSIDNVMRLAQSNHLVEVSTPSGVSL